MAKKRSTTPSRATKKYTPKVRKNIKKSTPKQATKSRSRTPQAKTTPVATTPVAVTAVDTTPVKQSKIKRTKTIQEAVAVAQLTQKSAGKRKLPRGNRKAKGPKRPSNKGGKAKGGRKGKK